MKKIINSEEVMKSSPLSSGWICVFAKIVLKHGKPLSPTTPKTQTFAIALERLSRNSESVNVDFIGAKIDRVIRYGLTAK